MPMNLAGMGGAAGAGDAMATLFDQRMRAAQLQQQDEHFKAQQAQQDALTRLKAQEQADAIAQRLELAKQAQTDRADAAKHLNLTRIDAQLKEIPTDTPLSQPTVAGMTDAGITPERFSPTPIRPDQSAAGSVADTAPPASIAAPDQPPPMPGTVANSPMPGRVSFTRIPTAQELQHQADQSQLLTIAGDKHQPQGQVHDTPGGLFRIGDDNSATPVLGPDGKPLYGYHAPTQAPGDKLVKVEHKGSDGRTVIEWLPQSEVKGKTFEKGVSGATETRLASAEAVTQTGQDIIKSLSDPAVKATLGPLLGRYSSLHEFIGDPPPEFNQLAGQIESFAMANMGVHGMRSSAGVEKVKALLDGHHTPESLAAGIKGLSGFSEHFMQNEGRGKGSETPEQRKARIRKAAGL